MIDIIMPNGTVKCTHTKTVYCVPMKPMANCVVLNSNFPSSTAVDCGALESPQYGTVKYTDTTYKSEAHYSCRHGYTIWRGDKTRVCLAGGEWSGSAPFCISKP